MKTAILAAVVLVTAVPAAQAAVPGRTTDPDWPCQQIKVPELSVAAIWTGPSIDPYTKSWSQNETIADFVHHLALRRVPIEQAQQDIADFAKKAGADKQQQLLSVLAGLFSALGDERRSVIAGLDRFGRRQKEYATQIRSEIEQLREAQDKTPPDQQKIADLTQRVNWDTQIFEDRHSALQTACDVPNVIEQRLFALARAIQQELD